MVKETRILMVLFVVLALSGSTGRAEIITIGLSAEIIYMDEPVWDMLDGQVNIGDMITGRYIYDSATVDTDPSSTIGEYHHSSAPYGITLSVGGFLFQTDPDNVDFMMGTLNNHDGQDAYGFASYNNLPLSNGLNIEYIGWALVDYSATALSSDALPLTAPVLEAWDSPLGLDINLGSLGAALLRSNVTSVELVPEPATVLLVGLGGLALLLKRHKA